MSFAAKYSGRCDSDPCRYSDGIIREGDEVEYFDDELMHSECAKNARRGDPPRCPKCWLYHRGECA